MQAIHKKIVVKTVTVLIVVPADIRGIRHTFLFLVIYGLPKQPTNFPYPRGLSTDPGQRDVEFSAVEFMWCYVLFCFAEGDRVVMCVCLHRICLDMNLEWGILLF